jgi:hypothetical protein
MSDIKTLDPRPITVAEMDAFLAAGGKVTQGEPAVAPGAAAPNVALAAKKKGRRQAARATTPAGEPASVNEDQGEERPVTMSEGGDEQQPVTNAPVQGSAPEAPEEAPIAVEIEEKQAQEAAFLQAIDAAVAAALARGVPPPELVAAIERAGLPKPAPATRPAAKAAKVADYRKLKLSADDVITGVLAVNPWQPDKKGHGYYAALKDGMTDDGSRGGQGGLSARLHRLEHRASVHRAEAEVVGSGVHRWGARSGAPLALRHLFPRQH